MSVELVKRVSAVTGVVILVTEEFAQTLPSEWVDPDAKPSRAKKKG